MGKFGDIRCAWTLTLGETLESVWLATMTLLRTLIIQMCADLSKKHLDHRRIIVRAQLNRCERNGSGKAAGNAILSTKLSESWPRTKV